MVLLRMSLHMGLCYVRTVLQGLDLKLELAEELLASTARCCRRPGSPLEDKGVRKVLFTCIRELGCNLVCHRMSDNTTG